MRSSMPSPTVCKPIVRPSVTSAAARSDPDRPPPIALTNERSILMMSTGKPAVAHRRVAGTEVVERDANAQLPQLLQLGRRHLDVVDERSFGQLDDEILRPKPG